MSCFCKAPHFRSMHGKRELCRAHWWEWKRRLTARKLRLHPENMADPIFWKIYFRSTLEALGLHATEPTKEFVKELVGERGEQLKLFSGD